MKCLIILVLTISASCLPIIGFPMKRVIFPSDSEENDETPQYDGGNDFKTIENVDIKPKVQFRIDAATIPCANSSIHFCEGVSQQLYPSKYINSVLQKSGEQYAEFFNKVEMRENFPEPINLCDTHIRVVYPQIAMNINSDWHFIINQPDYPQHVRVELCQKRSSQCKFSETFPLGYVSSCTQKYAKVPLLSLDDDGSPSKFEYEFPSHCQCELHEIKSTKNQLHNKKLATH